MREVIPERLGGAEDWTRVAVNGDPRLTVGVVICAYTERRWQHVRSAVASVLDQTSRASEVVLVVDHNPALAVRARAELAEHGQHVVVVENRRTRGLSGARNTGVEAVHSDVVAFLDDDASARPDWLSCLVAAYRHPRVSAVGGPARPVWPGTGPPGQLPPELHWVVGCSFTGQHTGGTASEVRNLMGCNMSFRRAVFDRIGGFAEDLGRVTDVPLGCEETELCIRLRQRIAGSRVLFEPRAVVDHQVSPDRTTWSYLRRRSWAEGLSKAVVARSLGASDGLAAERAYTRRVLPAAVRREVGAMWRGVLARDRARLRRAVAAALAVNLAFAFASLAYVRGLSAGRIRIEPAVIR